MGSVNGEVTFFDIQDMEVGPEGNIFIAQRSSQSIAVFGPDGAPKEVIGRAGQGPGEFASPPSRLTFLGDTLVVTERFGTHFFVDDTEVRRVSFRAPFPAESSTLIAGTPLADGSFLGYRFLNPPVKRFFLSNELPLRRFTAGGMVLDTLAWVEQPPAVDFPDPNLVYVHPLAAWTGEPWIQAVATRDGRGVLLLRGLYDDVQPASFELMRVDIAGDTVLHRRISYEPVPLDRAAREVLTEGFVAWASGGWVETRPDAVRPPAAVMARRARDARRAFRLPEHYPPVRQMVAGNDGSIWLLRSSAPLPSDLWEIYDEAGELMGTVEVAEGRTGAAPWTPRLKVFRATRDEVWAVTIDDFDVPYVHHYRVDRSCR